MKFNFRRTTRTVQEIYRDFINGELVVDSSYQRRRVWTIQDKVRLIETLLLQFVMPEVFFWIASRNADDGKAITHIVDGQQRICAIAEFINGEYCLEKKYLIEETTKELYGNKYFKDLLEEDKNNIWGYHVSYVDVDQSCNMDQIKQMFYRLNLTNYNLNPQERRNSLDSAFGDKSLALSNLDFWRNKKVFSSNDAKRMKDVEYCCTIYILAKEGIVDQANGRKINEYYDDYKTEFDEDNSLFNRVVKAMDIIDLLTDKSTLSFVSKKAQMYTLFSVAFNIIDQSIEANESIFEKFKQFVLTYNNFRNEFVLNYTSTELSSLYENIKKYKLASSEGINKITNRMIRFEILSKICINDDDALLDKLSTISDDLEKKLNERKKSVDNLEDDDIIDMQE